MYSKRFTILKEHGQLIRPIRLSVIAITTLAIVMGLKGWHVGTLILGGVLVLIAGLIIFQVHRAVSHLHRQSCMTKEAAAKAERHYIHVLWRVVHLVEARDVYTKGHSERVADLSVKIAKKMGMAPKLCAKLKTAARLHDLGRLAIPSKILNLPGRLGEDGMQVIRTHPDVAYEILKPLQSLHDVLAAIRHHHERMNGTGYPSGLCGEEIPIEARILAVADVFDAMIHDRPYRSAMPVATAVAELRRCSPEGYDPDCVEVLAKLKNVPELQEAIGCV